jgi:hypothetical protein
MRMCPVAICALLLSVPCCYLCPAPLYNIFPRYLTNGTIFDKKKDTEHKMCVLIFPTAFVWNIYNSNKN